MSEALRPAATVVLLRAASEAAEVLLVERPPTGVFGGAWVFPGGKVEPDDTGTSDLERAHTAAMRETAEEVGLVPTVLYPFSRWTPPEGAPARFETHFFLGEDPGGTIVPQPGEVQQWRWMTPAAALDAHGQGALRLFPPTWITLHHLQGVASFDEARARFGQVTHFTPSLAGIIGHGTLYLNGDSEHTPAAPADARHRLDMQQLPWTYTRS